MGIFSFIEKKVKMAELMNVTAEGVATQLYFKDLALQIGTSYYANAISKCEFKVFEGGKERKNELYYMLNVNPNPNQNSSQFLNALVTRYFHKGESLVYPDTVRNRLYVADGFSVDEKPLQENIFSNICIENETLRRNFRASDVFYFKLDDIRIKTLIDGAFGQYDTIMSSAIESFVRRNGQKYKLILDQYKAGDPEFTQTFNNVIKKQLEAFMKGTNAVYPQYKGTDLVDVSGSGGAATSSDVVAIRKEMFETVAQALKIPLAMMYGNITSINDVINMFLTFAIDPFADMIGEEFTRKIYPYNKWKSGNYIQVDTSCISHVDILDVADKVMNAVGSGTICIDEMRERIGKQPLNNDLGKQHFVTRNYATPEEVLSGESVKPTPNKEVNKPPTEPVVEEPVENPEEDAVDTEKGGEKVEEQEE